VWRVRSRKRLPSLWVRVRAAQAPRRCSAPPPS
jgi:hypothetical protein